MKNSVTEEYDNRNVIIQIAKLKDTAGTTEATAEAAKEALAKATTAEATALKVEGELAQANADSAEAKRLATEANATVVAVKAEVEAVTPRVDAVEVDVGTANDTANAASLKVDSIAPDVKFTESNRTLVVTVNGKSSSATISGGSGGGGTGTVSINQGPDGITINDVVLQDASLTQDGLMTKELVEKVNTAGDATAIANEAKQIAGEAKQTADGLAGRITTAEADITAAQAAADAAGVAAGNADTKAGKGVSDAATAQGRADDAYALAEGANNKATLADNKAIAAQNTANDALAKAGAPNTIKQVRDQITFWYTEVYEIRETSIGTWYDSDHKVGLVQNIPVTGGTAQGLVMNLDPLRTEPSATEKTSLSYPAAIMAEYASTCISISGNFTGIIRLTALPKLIRINNKDTVNAWYKEGWHFTNVDLEYKNGVLLSTDADNWPCIVRPDGTSTLTGASIEMKWNLMIREVTGGFE